MPPRPIHSYTLQWNIKSKASRIVLNLGDNKPFVLPLNSPEEFLAVSVVLNESPVYLYPDGTISTGWETPGDTNAVA